MSEEQSAGIMQLEMEILSTAVFCQTPNYIEINSSLVHWI